MKFETDIVVINKITLCVKEAPGVRRVFDEKFVKQCLEVPVKLRSTVSK